MVKNIRNCWGVSTLFAAVLTTSSGRSSLWALPGLRYAITDLGTLGGASQAHAINNRGQVVGESEAIEPKPGEEAEEYAFLWTDGRMRDLGSLPQSESEVHTSKAFALNNQGEVVGGSGNYIAIPPEIGFFVSASPFLSVHGHLRLLDKPTDGLIPYGEAHGINNQKEIVGTNSGGAFLWRSGHLLQLGTLQRRPYKILLSQQDSGAWGINDKGQIVGYADVDAQGSVTHPFLWQHGQMTDLGTPPGTTNGSASAINQHGDVVGAASGQTQGDVVWWWRRGRMHVLPNLPGTQASVINSVNDSLQIVGRCDQAAVLWKGSKPHDLNDLIASRSGWHLAEASGVNNRGQIVGFGTHNGKTRAFLLTPVTAHRRQRLR